MFTVLEFTLSASTRTTFGGVGSHMRWYTGLMAVPAYVYSAPPSVGPVPLPVSIEGGVTIEGDIVVDAVGLEAGVAHVGRQARETPGVI